MYEYTMDEEELKRCPSAQDYYALYRIFRKSGIGPKNGEQYGAPFREEDWADDDCLTVNPLVEQEKYTNQVNDVNVESPIPNDFEIPNIEELLDLLEDEPCTVEPLVCGEDTESTLLDHSSQNPNLPAQNAILHPTIPHNVQANFDVTQCSTSQPQLPEAPEFTSAPVYHGLNPQMVEEDYMEDFLEVDDLAGPEPSINNFIKPGETMGIQQYGYDMGTGEARHPNQPYVNNAENGMVNPVSTYFSNNHETMNSQQLYLNEDNEGSNRLWSPDQRCNVATPAEANHEVFHPATLGVVYDSHSLDDHPKGANSNQITREDGATNSRFSSALWGSLESIPATPASAAESPPADLAFEQRSRRSRVIARNMNNASRVIARNMNNASGNTSRNSGKSMSGFLCVFVLGVLCAAMLWVLLGTSSLTYGGCSLLNL
nr:NAC domain-containing protein 17-like [Ipomoea batatas]